MPNTNLCLRRLEYNERKNAIDYRDLLKALSILNILNLKQYAHIHALVRVRKTLNKKRIFAQQSSFSFNLIVVPINKF